MFACCRVVQLLISRPIVNATVPCDSRDPGQFSHSEHSVGVYRASGHLIRQRESDPREEKQTINMTHEEF